MEEVTTTMTSGNSRRKGKTTKGKKTGKNPMRYSGTMRKTSQTNRIKSDRNYIKIPAKKASSAKSIQSSKLVVTSAPRKHRYNNKILEKLKVQQ